MTCEEARMFVAEELAGNPVDDRLEAHLATCQACSAETARVRRLWSRIADLPAPRPSPYMTTRFYAALDGWQQAQGERRSGFWRWLPVSPAWQVATSTACVLCGLIAGTLLTNRGSSSTEVAELRKEMTGMRQLVTLSLLQQQSASERLRGVNWSYRAEPNDLEVLDALLQTVGQDSSVDVRLAAVDALRNFGDSPVARRGLLNALVKQESPLAQIAIIDALTEMRDRNAAAPLRTLLKQQSLDPSVRARAQRALTTIE